PGQTRGALRLGDLRDAEAVRVAGVGEEVRHLALPVAAEVLSQVRLDSVGDGGGRVLALPGDQGRCRAQGDVGDHVVEAVAEGRDAQTAGFADDIDAELGAEKLFGKQVGIRVGDGV